MLGRLEMDVDECIEAYTELMKTVFSGKSSRLPIDLKGKVKARFDSTKLRSAILSVMVKRGFSETDRFNDGVARGCRV